MKHPAIVSVLDFATVAAGDTIADAFYKSVAVAQEAEKLGYKRFWLAEHHNMESVASAATAVLLAHIGGNTKSIRIGAGGIMLPNHSPLVIAEQFGTLEALYPRRVDLGLGRAPGTDPLTARALRRSMHDSVDSFPKDVMELINFLQPHDPEAKVRAIPGEGSQVPVWLLGSSNYSAQLAAYLGLPFGFASHFAPDYLEHALLLYKGNFKAAEFLSEPYSLACVNIIAADTDEEAHHLARSFYQMALNLIRNTRMPLQPPGTGEPDWNDAEEAAVKRMMKYSFIGSVATIQPQLNLFLEHTNVKELMIASHVYHLEHKMKSMALVAGMVENL